MGCRSRFSCLIGAMRQAGQRRAWGDGSCSSRGHGKLWAWESRWTSRTSRSFVRAWDCCAGSSVSSAVDCSSVGLAWDDSFVSSVRVRLRVGQARLGRLVRLVCARSTATARLGMGSMGMEKARRRRWDERARAWDELDLVRVVCLAAPIRVVCACRYRAVEVAGVHCVRLNSHPSW